MGADNPGWVPPQAGTVRAVPVALRLVDRACARKHDAVLGNRLAGRAFGLLGCDAVRTIAGLRNAGRLAGGAPARGRVIDLAGAGDAGIGAVILVRDRGDVCEDRGARRVPEGLAAVVDLAGEMRGMGLLEPEDRPMALAAADHLTAVRVPRAVPGSATAGGS